MKFRRLAMSALITGVLFTGFESRGDDRFLTLKELQTLSIGFSAEFLQQTKKPAAPGEMFSNLELLQSKSTQVPVIVEKAGQKLQLLDVRNEAAAPVANRNGLDRPEGTSRARLTQWNIERGQQIDTIEKLSTYAVGAAKCDREKISQDFGEKLTTMKGNTAAKFIDEVCALSESDIIYLNEVDNGVCRSGYRDIAKDYADSLKMNYAFAPEFFEVEPAKNGLTPDTDTRCKGYDASKTKNLTGNAILSKYELKNVRQIQLPTGLVTNDGEPIKLNENGKPAKGEKVGAYCWDWHANETANPTPVDIGINLAGKKIFGESNGRELRIGRRNALVADVTLPDGLEVTLINMHLENRATPKCRQVQMEYVLRQQLNNPKPILLAGDLNTIESDGGSRSILSTAKSLLIANTIKSPGFYLTVAGLSAPTGLTQGIALAKLLINQRMLVHNPTRKNVFYFQDNPEGNLFEMMQYYYFLPGGPVASEKADYLVDPRYDGYWSGTNARDGGGFVTTHEFDITRGPWGKMKIDWFFVREGGDKNVCAIPRFARTLKQIKDTMGKEDYPTDHEAISLMIEEGSCDSYSLTKQGQQAAQ